VREDIEVSMLAVLLMLAKLISSQKLDMINAPKRYEYMEYKRSGI
jgi:hypothetical protein